MASVMAKAQMPYEQYSEDGISLDFKKIEDLDFRVYFMYNLQRDGLFDYMQDDEYGVFIVTPTDNDSGSFLESFDTYYGNKLYDFNSFSKIELEDHIVEWKSGIASTDMTSIMMDWFLRQSRVDNDHCANSLPFCTSETITFEAANTSNTANEPGMDDGCIGSSYNPSFYHMRIRVGGQFIIHMVGHDPNDPNIARDIDFCMWGPYTAEEVSSHSACSHLSSGKIIDCCYSAQDTEDCYLGYTEGSHIHNTSHGDINYHLPEIDEYYILMITNFSRQPCVISFSKVEGSGPGETDCDILPPLVSNDGPFCSGETIHLSANGQGGATYSWVGPNNFASTEQNPTLEDATVEMSGDYTCTITLGAQSSEATTEVMVYPMPNPIASAPPAQYGYSTTVTVDPGAEGDFTFHWEPADKVLDPDAQTTETVMLTDSVVFSVTVSSIGGHCTETVPLTVRIAGSNLTASATVDDDELCEGESTTLHAIPENGTHRYHFLWTGPDGFTSTEQNIQITPAVGVSTYTCIVDDELTQIPVPPIHVTVHPNEEMDIYPIICEGETYTFIDGHEYNTSCTKECIISTQYGCDSLVRMHLTVNSIYDESYTIDTCNEYHWDSEGKTIKSYTFNGHDITDETFSRNGRYKRVYESKHGCDSIVTLNVHFEYTPNPTDIIPVDTLTPHWVIPATEFQINSYEYSVHEHNIDCTWDTVYWSCDSVVNQWNLNWENGFNESDKHESICTVTVLEHVEGTIYLTAHIVSHCDTIHVKYPLICSFYGTEEQTASQVDFSVVPNPNKGEMSLCFDNLLGKVDIKVYDMSGNLIDSFETYNEMGRNSIIYNMKHHTPGIYYFVATSKEGTAAKKVVVTR